MTEVLEILKGRPSPFRTELAEFIYYRTYSRWVEELGRRETWKETVSRSANFLFKRAGDALSQEDRDTIAIAIHDHQAFPSMRLLWTAGPAADANEIALYNCSALVADDVRIFDEAAYILMSGTGFGFSVESEFVSQLPRVLRAKKGEVTTHVIEDSKEGWADAIRCGVKAWYEGREIRFDASKVRKAGERLMTMGGRASGPAPLLRTLDFIKNKIRSREGVRLRPIDVHDILCSIAESIVCGGVRRSSLISLSDLHDMEMRSAKDGLFYNSHPQRMMSNNSVAYDRKPDNIEFMEEWLSLAKSGSGERGIFNREAARSTAPRRKKYFPFTTNPCGRFCPAA